MSIKVRIKRYNSIGNTWKFPQYDMNSWLTTSSLLQLGLLDVLSNGPQFIKVEHKLPIRFTFYSKVASLNERVEFEDGYIWIPSEIIPNSIIFDKDTEVEINPVDLTKATTAESVTIKLNEKEVDIWSEEEVSFAQRTFRNQNGITFPHQLVFVKPRTKNAVIGEVISIFPRQESPDQLYEITKETKVFFEGLPKNFQKVIDFKQIGGLDNVIDKLREIIQLPITCPDNLARFGIKSPKGMLMYGPPGNGKTMIARAVAQSMGSSFISIEGPELMSQYVGVGEQRLREKFEEAETKGNAVIFIDEIDSIASKRSEASAEYQVKMVATLLILMDGLRSNNIFVIGATNRLNAIDPALRRPGRFDLEFEVPLPSTSGRLDILSKYVKLEKSELFDDTISYKTLQKLADLTTGYSGADISLLYREAAMIAIRKNIKIDPSTGKLHELAKPEDSRISNQDFEEAMRHIVPTSMRDVESVANLTDWNDLLAVDDVKNELEQLHKDLLLFVNSDNLKTRPSFANIIISGVRGSGKRTIVHSFASHFGYELFNLDLIKLQSLDDIEANQEIERVFSKAKQIAPSIVTITSVIDSSSEKQFLTKVFYEISQINKRTRLFVILIIDDKKEVATDFLGYKKFNRVIDIRLLDNEGVKALVRRLGIPDTNIQQYYGKPIAQIISEANESIINEE